MQTLSRAADAVSGRLAERRIALLAIATLAAAALVATPAAAAKRATVDLAHLASLPEGTIDALRDVQHAVQVAETGAAGARAAVDEIKSESKLSRETLSARNADLKAAKLELKAAKKNHDDERTAAADTRLAGAKAALAETKARLAWANKELKARQARVTVADAELEKARTALELARLQLLIEQGSEHAAAYAEGDFTSQDSAAQVVVDKARAKADKAGRAAETAKGTWERKVEAAVSTGS